MAIIQHGRYSVKTEAIKMEFRQPILTIGKQEMNDLVFAIIKAQAVPSGMLVTLSRIEVLIGVTCKISKTFYLILDSMGMNNIHDYSHSVLMGLVNELLQLLRSTETRR